MANNKFKSLFAGVSLALSKVEKGVKLASFGDPNNMAMEQQVRKQEIKILSKRRFYQIMGNADESQRMRYGDRNQILAEQRGLGAILRSFKNQRFGSFFESPDGIDPAATYKFITNNDLNMYVDTVTINKSRNNEDLVELNFVTNRGKLLSLDTVQGLQFLEINESGRKYLYNVTDYLGSVRLNDSETEIKFDAVVTKNGELPDYNDEQIVMGKSDLIKEKFLDLYPQFDVIMKKKEL